MLSKEVTMKKEIISLPSATRSETKKGKKEGERKMKKWKIKLSPSKVTLKCSGLHVNMWLNLKNYFYLQINIFGRIQHLMNIIVKIDI